MHIYQDTAHYNAPYANVAVQGFGAVTEPGATPATPAEPPAGTITAAHIDAVSEIGPDAIRRYKPEAKAAIMQQLANWGTTFLTNTQVKIYPFTAEQIAQMQSDPNAKQIYDALSAAAWVARKVDEGFAVFAPWEVMWPTTEAIASPNGIQLGGTPASERGTMQEASALGIGAYLAEPAMAGTQPTPGAPTKASMTPLLWAIGVIAVVGGGAVMISRGRRGKGRVAGRGIPASLRS